MTTELRAVDNAQTLLAAPADPESRGEQKKPRKRMSRRKKLSPKRFEFMDPRSMLDLGHLLYMAGKIVPLSNEYKEFDAQVLRNIARFKDYCADVDLNSSDGKFIYRVEQITIEFARGLQRRVEIADKAILDAKRSQQSEIDEDISGDLVARMISLLMRYLTPIWLAVASWFVSYLLTGYLEAKTELIQPGQPGWISVMAGFMVSALTLKVQGFKRKAQENAYEDFTFQVE